MAILTQTNVLALTVERAKEEANKAIEYLADIPESDYKQALISLARLSVERSF
jgi:octaprenyl-diphosphate synthase